LEVGVLDDSENCTTYRFQDGRGSNAAADVLDTAAWRCPGGEELCQGNIGVGDAPVGNGPCGLIAGRVQPKFITSDVEADVERFYGSAPSSSVNQALLATRSSAG
jgi:hypothetical protein